MIDIHLHILPGIDDGPETTAESLDLARVMVQEGIHAAIATPHYNDLYPQISAAEVQQRVYAFQHMLDHAAIPLRLYAGHEVLIKPGLVKDIQAGRVATLNNSRYLLLELWNSTWLPETERVIFELRASGIIPVIAHPERYRPIQHDPQRLVSLLQQGALAQLTAESLAGVWGKKMQHCAETLLKKRLIHFIASDAHGIKRPLLLHNGIHHAIKLLGRDYVAHMIEFGPACIINNTHLGPTPKGASLASEPDAP